MAAHDQKIDMEKRIGKEKKREGKRERDWEKDTQIEVREEERSGVEDICSTACIRK